MPDIIENGTLRVAAKWTIKTRSSSPRSTSSSWGLLTLGFDPTRFQTGPAACCRASLQLRAPGSHRQAMMSRRTKDPYIRTLPFCWAHEIPRLAEQTGTRP